MGSPFGEKEPLRVAEVGVTLVGAFDVAEAGALKGPLYCATDAQPAQLRAVMMTPMTWLASEAPRA